MRHFRFYFVFFILIFISTVHSQTDSSDVKRIILFDKSEFVGTIVSETDEIIFFKTNSGVEIEIKKSLVKEIQPVLLEIKTKSSYRPGDHELLFMPTAYTMEAGQSYLSDYELFFLNYTFAASPRTHVGFFTLFPIASSFLETMTLGIKQNYLKSENVQAALWGTYTPKASALTLGNVFSYGTGSNSFHMGLSGMTGLDDDNDEWQFVYMFGSRIGFSKKVSITLEYTNTSIGAENSFNGLISIGFRFTGESVSWELGGFRPLESTGDLDLILFPVLKATVLFD